MTRVSRDLRRFRTVLELLVKMGMGMVSWILQIIFFSSILFPDGGSLLLKSFFSFYLFQWNVIPVHYNSIWLKSDPGCHIYTIQFTCRHSVCGWRGDRTGQCHSSNQRTVNEWSRPRQRSRPRKSRWQRWSSTDSFYCWHQRRSGAAKADVRSPTCRSGTAHDEPFQLSAASFLVRQPAGGPFLSSVVCSSSRSKFFFLSCRRITWINLAFFLAKCCSQLVCVIFCLFFVCSFFLCYNFHPWS